MWCALRLMDGWQGPGNSVAALAVGFLRRIWSEAAQFWWCLMWIICWIWWWLSDIFLWVWKSAYGAVAFGHITGLGVDRGGFQDAHVRFHTVVLGSWSLTHRLRYVPHALIQEPQVQPLPRLPFCFALDELYSIKYCHHSQEVYPHPLQDEQVWKTDVKYSICNTENRSYPTKKMFFIPYYARFTWYISRHLWSSAF